MTNKELTRVTYIFVTLFLVLMGYLVYFNVVKSKEVVNSTYNIRQDLLADRVLRGSITDKNGEVLAQTVTNDDGSETREYPEGEVFAHVVGYAAKGKSGLESSQNFNLLTSNAFFLEKLANEFKDQKNTGDTVVTTLDANLQNAAYNALGDNKGAVVVMEPSTGKILAMVSKPSFDPNNVSENWDALNNDENSSLLNRATLGQYTPGSTFKLVTTLAFMRQNPDYNNYSFECNGEFSQNGATIHCYNSTAHGEENLMDSVANSCNSSFSNIGLQLDKAEWRKTAKQMLFNGKLPGDVKYLDYNGDGVVDEDDKCPIGYSSVPEIVYGFGTQLFWKGFDFGIFFRGQAHVTYGLGGDTFIPFNKGVGKGNLFEKALDRWTEDNPDPDAFYPRLSNGASSNNWQSSTRTTYNGRLLRLADLEFGYTFKKDWSSKMGMKSLRIYCLANNVALFAPWDMWDPETASFNGSKYPLPRKVNFGIRASF